MPGGFSGGKQVINFSQTRKRDLVPREKPWERGEEIAVKFYSWQQNRKWTTFYIIKRQYGKLWEEVIIVTFFNAVATVDVKYHMT